MRAGTCSIRKPRSGSYEGQKVGVNRVRFRGGHTVREAFVAYKGSVLQQLSGPRAGGDIRYDLIVLAMHDQDWNVDLLEIFRKIRLGKGHDTVVMRFGSAHHALAPPILNDSLRSFRARPVVAVERSRRHFAIERRTIRGELRL